MCEHPCGLRPRQNEDTLWRAHCVLRCCPPVAKRGNIVARRADTRDISDDFQKHSLCRTQMLREWQNESTFGAHDHLSNVAATMCPRFVGPLLSTARGPQARVERGRELVRVELTLTFSLPRSKGTFSQPFKRKCITDVVRIW